MDDLTLAARTLLGSHPEMSNAEFESWYRSMGVDKRFSGVAGFGYVELVREPQRDVYPPGERPYYCLPRLGVAGPGMDDTLGELPSRASTSASSPSCSADTRDSGEFSAFVVTSSHGHEMFEVVAPVYRGGGVPTTSRPAAPARPAGSSACSTPSRSCGPRSPARAASPCRSSASTPRSPRTASRPAPAPRSARCRRRCSSTSVARYGRRAAGDALTGRMSVEADGRWTVSVTARRAARHLRPRGPGHGSCS